MAWQSKYNAFGTEPLIRQMFAILQRDIQAALDFQSGVPGSLPPFVSYHLAESAIHQYPAILLVADSIPCSFDETGLLHESPPLTCILQVAHQDPNQCAIWVQQYAMAVWMVWATAFEATTSDFYAEGLALPASAYGNGQVTEGLTPGILDTLHITRPEFGELRTAKSLFVKAAGMGIQVGMSEPAAY
jgi:hypothetical protein